MFLTKSFVAPQVEVVPVKRIQAVLEMKPLDYKDMGPCGGFSTQYACYCDYYNMPYRLPPTPEIKYFYVKKYFCVKKIFLCQKNIFVCVIKYFKN